MSRTPMGTFSQKIHCQAIPWTIAPPTSGPKATARPLMPPQAPRARPRFAAGTALERMVSVSGITIAPPSPWKARARLSVSTEGASAAATEPIAERGSGQEQHRERQRVGVDRPLQARERRVQVLPDHRDRGRDHEVVERDHEQRDRADRERPERPVSCHLASLGSSFASSVGECMPEGFVLMTWTSLSVGFDFWRKRRPVSRAVSTSTSLMTMEPSCCDERGFASWAHPDLNHSDLPTPPLARWRRGDRRAAWSAGAVAGQERPLE